MKQKVLLKKINSENKKYNLFNEEHCYKKYKCHDYSFKRVTTYLNNTSFFLCGYIYIEKTLFNELFDSDMNKLKEYFDDYSHCGITLKKFVNDNVMIGFDCNHGGDLSSYGFIDCYKLEDYRDVNYVISVCKDMINALHEKIDIKYNTTF